MGYREEQLLPVLAQSVTRILRVTLSLILSCHENCNKFKGSLSQRERPTVRNRNPLAAPSDIGKQLGHVWGMSIRCQRSNAMMVQNNSFPLITASAARY